MGRDARGHLHDALGRFARSGALKVERGQRLPSPTGRRRRDEGEARRRYRSVTEAGDAARYELAAHRDGHSTKPWLLTDFNGSPKNEWDVVHDAVARARSHPTPRKTTKRTASGRAYVERGYGTYTTDDGWIRGLGQRLRPRNSAGTPEQHAQTARTRQRRTARDLMRGG